MKDARKQLKDAQIAHADQSRAFEDLKSQRKTVAKEKKRQKAHEKAFEEGERAAKLDGQGELDVEDEIALRAEANDAKRHQVSRAAAPAHDKTSSSHSPLTTHHSPPWRHTTSSSSSSTHHSPLTSHTTLPSPFFPIR